ncbi:hypothetical protein TNIN_371381 [Trichonephila inaurata madagascariensis]|uniref:Uncharacterized protein n=1 Tax=Trichonephila inaurata madagascariensis TaxID=2747483 RepID=A0A8X6XA53_9ARAC|nr:hypothetical protein TNIN_137271 [Trichonephila inaurata madagascariensis]GFY52916.1 hypothetical protein TNIN_371381 [Trichonephila inaurata madagascariensis]
MRIKKETKIILFLSVYLLIAPVMETSIISSGTLKKIYALSSFKLPEATHVKNALGFCPKGYLFDVKYKRCRWLICPEGYEKRDKICVER